MTLVESQFTEEIRSVTLYLLLQCIIPLLF